MVRKKNYAVNFMLTFDELKQATLVFNVLMAVNTRVGQKKEKKKTKKKDAHTKQCSWIRTGIFIAYLVFRPKTFILIQSCIAFIQQAILHDRYHCSALNTGYVSTH